MGTEEIDGTRADLRLRWWWSGWAGGRCCQIGVGVGCSWKRVVFKQVATLGSDRGVLVMERPEVLVLELGNGNIDQVIYALAKDSIDTQKGKNVRVLEVSELGRGREIEMVEVKGF